MSKGNALENDFLNLIFQGTPIANLADNAASSPATSLYLSLHTGDPGDGGDQSTSEVSYTGYARVGVTRDDDGWTESTSGSTSPVADIIFGACTAIASAVDATHAVIGTASTGSGKILYSGPLTPNIHIDVGVTPAIGSGSTITED